MTGTGPKASLLIRGGTVVALDASGTIQKADVLIEGNHIVEIGERLGPAEDVIDATGCWVLPGFVQTHVHTCQTLFRNLADDLPLLEWLRRRVWPLEAAHDEASLRASARLGIAELLLGGTTTVLDMGTVRLTHVLFETAEEMGIRAVIGKALMDLGGASSSLGESTEEALQETERLIQHYHGAAGGRLRYAVSPRFALSCSERALRGAAELARERGVLIHTHAAETKPEVEHVRQRTGMGNVEYLHHLGISGPDVCIAHCVWVSEEEESILAETGTHVLHCPSANLKLGSGIAPVGRWLNKGIHVSLGADGAPCNNNLSAFQEMRLASLLQKPRFGADALAAETVLRMATIEGARALGLADEIGSLEPGKKADVVVVRADGLHQIPADGPYGQLVYASRASDVRTVMVDGRVLVRDGHLVEHDEAEIAADALEQLQKLTRRAGI